MPASILNNYERVLKYQIKLSWFNLVKLFWSNKKLKFSKAKHYEAHNKQLCVQQPTVWIHCLVSLNKESFQGGIFQWLHHSTKKFNPRRWWSSEISKIDYSTKPFFTKNDCREAFFSLELKVFCNKKNENSFRGKSLREYKSRDIWNEKKSQRTHPWWSLMKISD